jgi:hypothetical protein
VSEWRSYETVYKGPTDRRLQHILAIVTNDEELTHYVSKTVDVLRARDVQVDVVVAVGESTASGVEQLGLTSLDLPADGDLRDAFVERIRGVRPDVVVGPDPTPVLRRHPDSRAVAQAVLDAAWPYAGADRDERLGQPHAVKEAWLYGGPSPDLFLRIDEQTEEKFAQVDLRERHREPKEPS